MRDATIEDVEKYLSTLTPKTDFDSLLLKAIEALVRQGNVHPSVHEFGHLVFTSTDKKFLDRYMQKQICADCQYFDTCQEVVL